ncbi:MAG: DNA adenine methylase, partial [Actinobacteria bacterium]|nr:DNA adenine methylase [Actinomycetota bacterium]
MYRHLSPLRYPGGKTSLWKYLGSVIEENKIEEAIYIEPFAGGAGAALNLLVNGYVKKIVLNDLDERIYKFWKAVLNDTDEFIARIISTPLSITEWRRQKELLRDKDFVREGSAIDVGFASFFLNRCNRSGILSAGPIGGIKQTGEWKIDARFNKTELISRIEKIAQFQERIEIYNKDGLIFLKEYLRKMNLMKYRIL